MLEKKNSVSLGFQAFIEILQVVPVGRRKLLYLHYLNSHISALGIHIPITFLAGYYFTTQINRGRCHKAQVVTTGYVLDGIKHN